PDDRVAGVEHAYRHAHAGRLPLAVHQLLLRDRERELWQDVRRVGAVPRRTVDRDVGKEVERAGRALALEAEVLDGAARRLEALHRLEAPDRLARPRDEGLLSVAVEHPESALRPGRD